MNVFRERRDTSDENRCSFQHADFCIVNQTALAWSVRPASIMAEGRITFGALIAVCCVLIFPHQVPAQPSTVPPSSLSTRPLVPWTAESELRPSCDLCRKPDARAGSDLRPHRLHREKGLRPHKNAKGTHRSLDQSLKSTLPRHPFAAPEIQGQQDPQTSGPAE